MKTLIRASFALALASLALAGCTNEQLAADMARAKEIAAAISRGAAVATSAVRQGLDAACANQGAVGVAYQAARSILMQQTGPNSTQNIDNLDKAMRSYTDVCAAAADPNAPDVSSLLRRAIAAYAAFEKARSKAGS